MGRIVDLKNLDEWEDEKIEDDFAKRAASPPAAEGSGKKDGMCVAGAGGKEDEDGFNPVNKEKKEAEFRNYKNSARQKRVQTFYDLNHTHQTYDFVQRMHDKHGNLKKLEMGVWEALEYLNTVVDDSDPDTNLDQMQHALQTAEAIRAEYPGEEYDWFHLTGLIHDLGKFLAVTDPDLKLEGDPQWAVVGDTNPVGCAFSDKIVFSEFFAKNPDSKDETYNTLYGVHKPNCGLFNVNMSWGHDEYLYRVCVGNNSTLPLSALYMIRFHSFYAWHREGAYDHLCNEEDRKYLAFVQDFNRFDLYSKAHDSKDVDKLKPYYQSLIKKYFPAKVRW